MLNKGYYPQFPEYAPRPGGAEYHRVEITTEEGLKEAERYHTSGWAMAQSSPFSITFWRPKNANERPA
jgi:hypothetical protein